jgi:hypothetical protein
MSMTIWKYPFEITGPFELMLPTEAKILSVDVQGEQPCMWALVEAENILEERRFVIVGTGHPAPTPTASEYIGTFQQPPFVWHLFELSPNKRGRG